MTVPCMYCGQPTPYEATQKCSPCWELDWRIRASPLVAKKVLQALAEEAKLSRPRRKSMPRITQS